MSLLTTSIILTFLILFEINEYTSSYLNSIFTLKLVSHISNFKHFYNIRSKLNLYPRYISFLVYIYHLVHTVILVKIFFQPDLEYSSIISKFATLMLAMPIFMFSNESDHKEIEESAFHSQAIATFIKYLEVCDHYFKLSRTHLKSALKIESVDDFNINTLFYNMLITFGIYSGSHFAQTYVLLIKSNFNQKHIFSTFRRMCYYSSIVASYFLIFNPIFGEYIYENYFKILESSYIGAIIYKILPKEKSVIQRIYMHIAIYFIK